MLAHGPCLTRCHARGAIHACDGSGVNASHRDGPVSVREAAERLGVHPQTIRRLIHEGKLEGVRIGTGLYVPRAALDELLSRQRRPPVR